MAYHSRPDVDPEVERDIWIATRDSTSQEFGNAAPLGPAVNEYSETWPNLSGDGLASLSSDWIEFAPRPGGQGSLDIWVSYRQSRDEEFVSLANLNDFWPGTDVNGASADAAPYLSPNWPAVGSKLYFVSNRLTGALVADVFQATWVPEPSTMLLVFLGLIALGKFRN